MTSNPDTRAAERYERTCDMVVHAKCKTRSGRKSIALPHVYSMRPWISNADVDSVQESEVAG